jgi:hypothetical protein
MKGRDLLRDRDFRLVAGSVGLSALGDWVAIVALGLHIKDVTDSGFAVAGLWICLFGPSVAVAGHAGLVVDRIEATRLLAAVSVLGAVVAAVLIEPRRPAEEPEIVQDAELALESAAA